MKTKNNEKKTNQKKTKSLLKSVLIFVGIMFISFIVGFSIAFFEEPILKALSFFDGFTNNFDNYMVYALPWIFALVFIIAGGISLGYYLRSKKLFSKWDGEDEDSICKIEKKISISVIVSNLGTVLDYLLIGVGMHYTESEALTIPDKTVAISTFVSLAIFLIGLIYYIVIQRCAVELEKKINPEKRGEVLDMNFQKEWENSFDEAEKALAGKAAFKSFKVTNISCVILALVAIIGQSIFNFGVAPIIFVTAIWLISILTYQIEALKLETKR